ncbi:sniffer [Athelia psychrophila]|uniref:Sniffer n=1 Tax=Athelia psychrophila TaxID=1759441 RepID=A0A166GTX9_9AGAM|nr:sniffer [Fibularhizoctonia sp. CBS 109695]
MEYVWFVTGTSQGIGLEIVKQLIAVSSHTVFAGCRNPDSAADLQALKTSAKGILHIVTLDVDSQESIQNAADATKALLGDRGVDYLINNAAISEGFDTAFNMSAAGLMRTFQTNVAGPAQVTRAMLPLVERGNRKVVVNISSTAGTFGKDLGPIVASYSVTKAALNMLTLKQASERPDLIIFAVDPGWVRTAMGGEGVPVEAQDTVSNLPGHVAHLLTLFESATRKHSCKIWTHTGQELPW